MSWQEMVVLFQLISIQGLLILKKGSDTEPVSGLFHLPIRLAFLTIWTVPVGLNYLFGKSRHYLETGLGATFYFYNGNGSDFWGNTEVKKGTGIVFIPSAGYRYSPYGKAFQGRLFVSPLIDAEEATFYWGLSVGFKF